MSTLPSITAVTNAFPFASGQTSRGAAKQYANADFHGDERQRNVLQRKLIDAAFDLASQVQLGGIVTGRVADGQNSQTINLGFKPAFVRATALSGTIIVAEFYSGMANSSAIIMKGAATGGGTGSFANLITTGGITPSATGFKMGSAISISGVPIAYYALRRVGP